MILPEHANGRSLVVAPTWTMEGMHACCSSEVPIRLEANYTNTVGTKTALDRLIACKWQADPVAVHMYMYAPRQCTNEAFSMTLDQAYGSVLAEMLEGCPRDMVYIVTDNVSRDCAEHDMHAGPFCTRGLPRWVQKNGIGNVVRGAHNRFSNVVTWSWVLDIARAMDLRNKLATSFTKRHNAQVAQLPEKIHPVTEGTEELIVWR